MRNNKTYDIVNWFENRTLDKNHVYTESNLHEFVIIAHGLMLSKHGKPLINEPVLRSQETKGLFLRTVEIWILNSRGKTMHEGFRNEIKTKFNEKELEVMKYAYDKLIWNGGIFDQAMRDCSFATAQKGYRFVTLEYLAKYFSKMRLA